MRGPESKLAVRRTTGGTSCRRSTTGERVAAEVVTLAHDPQTSGGLLAAIPTAKLADIEAAFNAAGVDAWRVGRVEEGAGVGLE